MEKQDLFFALDIGTRSVVGLILKQVGQKVELIDWLMEEHDERSMLDGQIHDVQAVSHVVSTIKRKLEEAHGPLKRVSVAAAGRALKTMRTEKKSDISGLSVIEKDHILHLELSAIQDAQFQLANENDFNDHTQYYCVGYSVIHYYLDDEPIGNLLDHQGKEAAVEIIATFLPKVVIESLLSALQKADLEMEALTLEPIAAINVLIPASMRRLNIALVDIGAGTSDIAITAEGTVVAYGMVPVAGDEITEAISDHYLLDFPLAEKAKRELLDHETILMKDILGIETSLSKEEIVSSIHGAIDNLASTIQEEIFRLNKKSPQAVMLIGGGSLTPELPALLAKKLGLPENRVAIRGIDAISNLERKDDIPGGPELVTPIGIAIASTQHPVHYISVKVNGRTVRLFDMKHLTIGDSLLAAGITITKLYGKPGLGITVTLNSQNLTIPGSHGTPPVLKKNGLPAHFDDSIKSGDEIIVEKGQDGQSAEVTIHDLIGEISETNVWINGKRHDITGNLRMNGEVATAEMTVSDRAKIEFDVPETIRDLIHYANVPIPEENAPFIIFINEKQVVLSRGKQRILLNDKPAHLESRFQHLDRISIKHEEHFTAGEALKKNKIEFTKTLPITFNGEPVELSKETSDIYREGEKLSPDEILRPFDRLNVIPAHHDTFIFQDIFRVVDIEMTPPSTSKGFSILLNGQEAAFHDILSPGDNLEFKWVNNTVKKP